MSVENPKFVHHFLPGEDAVTLLLLHRTGGDENNLIRLGRELAPGSCDPEPVWQGLRIRRPSFRRFGAGVFEHEDLVNCTHELREFIEVAAKEHGFGPAKLVAV
jgi:phospholipase/carboxylesterase